MIGQEVLNYRLLSQIGEGGMGSVYLAKDKLLDRKLAVKILSPSLARDSNFIDRFVLEAKVLSQLEHENIVKVMNFFEYHGNYYMVMEYAEGRTLKDLIKSTGPIPEKRALEIFVKISNSLDYAHSKNIIHRDVKPENIIINQNDAVKILDFGIAKILDSSSLTRTGTKMGTLYYMSPEQIKADKNIDHKTDIYSLGIVLYEMLTGQLPFNTKTDSDFEIMKEIVEGEIKNPKEFYPYISDDTVDLVSMMTYKEKEMRIDNLAFCRDICDNIMNNVRSNSNAISAITQISKKPSDKEKAEFVTDCSYCYKEIEINNSIMIAGNYVCPYCNCTNDIDDVFKFYCWNCNSKVMYENTLCEKCKSKIYDFDKSVTNDSIESGIKPRMFSQPFSFEGRIRRTEYGLSIIIFYLASLMISLVTKDSSDGAAIVALILYVPIYWFLWAQGAKRCHDLGNNGFFQIIPFYVFWLIFVEGERGNNKYGQNPKGIY